MTELSHRLKMYELAVRDFSLADLQAFKLRKRSHVRDIFQRCPRGDDDHQIHAAAYEFQSSNHRVAKRNALELLPSGQINQVRISEGNRIEAQLSQIQQPAQL